MTATRAWCGIGSSICSIGVESGTTAAAAAVIGGRGTDASAPKANAKIAPPPTVRRKLAPTVRFTVQPPSLSWIRCAVYRWPERTPSKERESDRYVTSRGQPYYKGSIPCQAVWEMTRLRINAMLSRIDHVGIAVRDLDEPIRIYERRLGLRATGRERLEREGIEIAMIPIGESRIELIMPLNSDSKVDKLLQDRGEAVDHVAYATDDVRASLEQAGAAGAQLLDEVARPGAHGTRIGFVHPKSVCGVLTEFVEADGHPRA